MNVTIVYADDLVIIDDKPQRFDLSPYLLPDGFWALQWHGDQGEIEFNNAKPNQVITELPEWTTAIIAEYDRLTEEALKPPPPPTPEEDYKAMIEQRNQFLDHSDWLIMRQHDQQDLGISETTLSSEVFRQALEWRQQLRDMPAAIAQRAMGARTKGARRWTWPPIPPELGNDFPDYPPV